MTDYEELRQQAVRVIEKWPGNFMSVDPHTMLAMLDEAEALRKALRQTEALIATQT